MKVASRISWQVLLLSAALPGILHAQERVNLREIFGQGVRAVLTTEEGDADTTSASGIRLLPGQIIAAVQERPISVVAQAEPPPPPPPPPPPGPDGQPPVGDPLPFTDPQPALEPLIARLPEFLMLDSSGETALQLTPIVLAQQGLRFTGRAYQAVLYLGVSDNMRSEATALSGPFAMQIVSTVGSVAPGQIEITHTNPPYATATLSLERAPQDSLIEITVLTASSPLGARVTIPVHPTRISIEAVPPRIQGLGLERADIVVALPMEVRADSVRVTLRSSGARPDPVVLHLHQDETAVATIRSARVGRTTVQAVSPALGLASDPVEIQFTFPIWFLASALLGGLVGGLVAWLRSDRSKQILWYLLAAVLTGLLVAAFYVAGLNPFVLPALKVDVPYVLDDVLVFAMAAIGALYGLPKVLGGAPEAS